MSVVVVTLAVIPVSCVRSSPCAIFLWEPGFFLSLASVQLPCPILSGSPDPSVVLFVITSPTVVVAWVATSVLQLHQLLSVAFMYLEVSAMVVGAYGLLK